MLIKFITAMAWMWGGGGAFFVLIQFVPPIRFEDMERALRNAIWSTPAWAWLIARYWL